MADEEQFQTLVMNNDSDMIAVSHLGQLVPYFLSDGTCRAPADFSTASAPAGHTLTNTVPVKFLSDEELLPQAIIDSIPQGSREYFATQANLR